MTSSVRAKMAQVEKEKKAARREAAATPEVATEMVRARNDKGHYIADDPNAKRYCGYQRTNERE